MHGRIFNGMAKEIREEVANRIAEINNKLEEKIASVQKLVVGILIALLLSLAGIIVESRVSANQSSIAAEKNYKAIVDIGSKLEAHIILTEPKK